MLVAVRILSLCPPELEICLGTISPPVAGKRRKKSLQGERLTDVFQLLLQLQLTVGLITEQLMHKETEAGALVMMT